MIQRGVFFFKRCAFSHGFLRSGCGRDASGQCVYCGETFCDEHGIHGEDYLEVCDRWKCRAKLDDVRLHQDWVSRMRSANDVQICAGEWCRVPMQHQCMRCRLMFCTEHLRAMEIKERRYDPPRQMAAVLCEHCVARRKLWD
jgi:hypothetical protein